MKVMSGELQLPRLCVNIGYTQQLPAACHECLSGWLTSSHVILLSLASHVTIFEYNQPWWPNVTLQARLGRYHLAMYQINSEG